MFFSFNVLDHDKYLFFMYIIFWIIYSYSDT